MTWRRTEGSYPITTKNACQILNLFFNKNRWCVILTLNLYFAHLHPAQSITLPMWDSEVTNYETEIHIANTASKVMWSCKATANEHEGEKCK